LVEVAIQMLEALQEIHSIGYVHRGVSPKNFMIDQNVVKLVKFGASIEYIRNGVHSSQQRVGSISTSTPYSSLNSLMGFNCFRSDDLESLGYSLMDLIDKEKVPWAHITDKV
jgi:serine/threonine protein kinase